MTVNPTLGPSFGRSLGEAARKIRKLHLRALSDLSSDFPSWMLFTLLTEKSSALSVDEVVSDLDQRMDLAEPDVISLLERSATAGFIAYRPGGPAPTAELTEAGSAHFASMYAHARKVTDSALDGIDPELLKAAVTVLVEVDQHAASLLDS